MTQTRPLCRRRHLDRQGPSRQAEEYYAFVAMYDWANMIGVSSETRSCLKRSGRC
jgi:hypothetical protein